nr:SDR family NAD(P)-dependent oxidoreductase [Angustibacter aerolatus]
MPDPTIQEPTDAIIEVTSTAICGSDLHLYEVLGPYLAPGDVLGHETMGVVQEVGAGVTHIKPGDRVVVPFNISCGACWMCSRGLYAQCETTQVTEQGKGASLFGYTSLYGSVPGGQAQYLRVPQAHFGPIPVPDGVADERVLYLSDILPTAWQGVAYADVPEGGTLAIWGLGPVGQAAARVARHLGVERVIGVDVVPERLALAAAQGFETIDMSQVDDVAEAVIDMTDGRGADGTLEAVGMEAHGSPRARLAHAAVGLLPDKIADPMMDKMAVDRLDALHTAIKACRRGGTVSISGVYGGELDPMPMMEMFDRGLQAAHGPVPREALDRRHPPRGARRRRPARAGVAGHAPGAAGGGRAHVRGLPEEGGRVPEGRPEAVTGSAPSTVLVTGASSGIGLATAHLLAGQGHRLALLARGAGPLAEAAAQCREPGRPTCSSLPVDVRDAEAVTAAVERTRARLGPLDVVIQCAGVAGYGRFEEVPAEVFEGVIATNLFGAANVARSVLPAMRAADHGTLVIVGSVVGNMAVPQMSPYVVSKWGIRSLVRHLQIEQRDRKGVRVSLVTPGGVDTPIYDLAATSSGYLGQPPPPVVTPQTVARKIVGALPDPPRRIDVGVANPLMSLGFTLLPRVFDAIVSPLFKPGGAGEAHRGHPRQRAGAPRRARAEGDPPRAHPLHQAARPRPPHVVGRACWTPRSLERMFEACGRTD